MRPVTAFLLRAALCRTRPGQECPHVCGVTRTVAGPGRIFRALLPVIMFFLAVPLVSGPVPDAGAAPNLTISKDMRITSDAEYNIITYSGNHDLTISGARLSATDIRCAGIHLLASSAVVSAADNLRMGPMYLQNSTLRAGKVLQSSATGQVVTRDSHLEGGTISFGWDYIIDGSNVPQYPSPDDTTSAPAHRHDNSVITASESIIFYGGLEVVSGTTEVTCAEGNIFARMVDGLTERSGATLDLRAPNGKITGQRIIATNLQARGIFANTVDMADGTFTLTGPLADNTVNETLSLRQMQSAVTALSVGEGATVSGGVFSAGELEAHGGLTVDAHARAGIETLTLDNETLLAVNSRVAVNAFRDSAAGSAVVGHNAALGLGTSNPDWIVRQFDAADGSSLGPVTAAVAVAAPQRLSNLPGIVVDGALTSRPASVTPASAVFTPRSLLVVSAAAANQSGAGALSGGSFDVQSGAKLYIPDAVNGGTYKVLAGEGAYADPSSWSGANLASGTPLLELVRLPEFGMIGTRTVPATTVFPGLDPSLAETPDEGIASGSIGPSHADSDIAGIRFLSRATGRDYIGNDPRLAAITIESAARIAALGAVPEMTMAANRAASNAMGQRTGGEPGGGLMAMDEGGAIEDDALHRHGWALWIMPLFQSTNGFGMTAGNWDMDFSGNLGGVAIGCDYTFESALRLGVSLNLGGGYARGSGDLAETTNDMGFWGLGAYAGWHAGDFGLAADVAYTSAYNSLRQELPAGMEMRPLQSEVSSWALGGGLRAEYRIRTPWLDVTPHAGARYLYLQTCDYDAKSNGTVLEGQAMRQHIWTFPAGLAFSRELELSRGWRCRPMLDFSVIPAAGDLKAKGDVHFTGVRGTGEVTNQTMDHVTWRGALGVEFSGGDVAFGLNYSFQAGLKTTAQGVTASFSYEF